MAKKDKPDNKVQEEELQSEIEADADEVEQEEVKSRGDEAASDEEQAESFELKKGVGDLPEMPAEVAAINTDNEIALEATEGSKTEKKEDRKKAEKKEKSESTKKMKVRSKRYRQISQLIRKDTKYSFDEALELVKSTAKLNFNSSIEVHIKLLLKASKKKVAEDQVRGIVNLPHGLGKELKVVVLSEEMIEEIAKTKATDFDIAIATPDIMPKMGKIAKILGPKGKMPNPKLGTITEDPERVKDEITKGRVEYKVDTNGVVHQMIGKLSWDDDKLKENYSAILNILPKNRIQSVVLTSTMGPGVKVEW